MRVVPRSRASKWLRRAHDPDPQLLPQSVPLLPQPELQPEYGEPACPNLFTIVNLKGIDDHRFVHLFYRALLQREPDEEGLNAYLRELAARPSPQQRESVARSFLASPEFRRGDHAREAEARRLAALVAPEFREEVGQIFADIVPDSGKMGDIWDRVLSTMFEENASFLRICEILGQPEVNRGWIGKIEEMELSGILPSYSIAGEKCLKIIFNGRTDDLPLNEAIQGSIDNGNGVDLYLVKIDLADRHDMSGMLHSVSIALANGTLIVPSPMYIYAPETCDLNCALDEAESGSYDLFDSKPFRQPSSPFLS